MSDLFFNKLAFCALSTGLLLTGLNEASHTMFPAKTFAAIAKPTPETDRRRELAAQLDYHALFAVADASAGKVVSSKCMSCHRFEDGAAALVGPPLFGVLGRDIGSLPGFSYSSGAGSLTSLEGAWTYEKLERFVKRPREFASGTAMNFPGIRKLEDRINLIAYLRTLTSGEPEPLP
jgi:cytochrome c